MIVTDLGRYIWRSLWTYCEWDDLFLITKLPVLAAEPVANLIILKGKLYKITDNSKKSEIKEHDELYQDEKITLEKGYARIFYYDTLKELELVKNEELIINSG